MLPVGPAKPSRGSRGLECFEKETRPSMCMFVAVFSFRPCRDIQQTNNTELSVQHISCCLQVLLALVALACVVLAEPQGLRAGRRPSSRPYIRLSRPNWIGPIRPVNGFPRPRPATRPLPAPQMVVPPAVAAAAEAKVSVAVGWAMPQKPWCILQWYWLRVNFCCIPYLEEL
jgi:hypothetical protein